MKWCAHLAILLAPVLASPVIAATADSFQSCDLNNDKRLSKSEFSSCLLRNDPILKKMYEDVVSPRDKAKAKAADLTTDAFDNSANVVIVDDEEAIPLSEFEGYLAQRIQNIREPSDLQFGWDSLRIERKITDEVNPREKKYSAAFVLSYLKDKANSDDSFVALGDITWLSKNFNNTFVDLVSSIDVSSKKDPSESSISVALPISNIWVYSDDSLLNSLTTSLEPKYITDRQFRRDVVQISAKVIPSSSKILRAGYSTSFGGDLSSSGFADSYIFSWQPVLSFEYGSINDAGRNEKLLKLQAQGSYTRIAPGVGVNLLWPSAIPLSFNASYVNRWDSDGHWWRGFLTTGFQYDSAKNFAVTLTYRRGRKPDTFDKTNEILLGIGFTKK